MRTLSHVCLNRFFFFLLLDITGYGLVIFLKIIVRCIAVRTIVYLKKLKFFRSLIFFSPPFGTCSRCQYKLVKWHLVYTERLYYISIFMIFCLLDLFLNIT